MKFVWIALAIGAIVLFAKKSKDGKVSQDSGKKKPHQVQEPQPLISKPESIVPTISAKDAFLGNIGRFKDLLPSLTDDTYNSKDWTDVIVDINNKNLIEYWNKVHRDKQTVLRILSSWGIKPDMCTSFVCMDAHRDLYILKDGGALEVGKKYNVVKRCWILTKTTNEGKSVKQVIVKGEIS